MGDFRTNTIADVFFSYHRPDTIHDTMFSRTRKFAEPVSWIGKTPRLERFSTLGSAIYHLHDFTLFTYVQNKNGDSRMKLIEEWSFALFNIETSVNNINKFKPFSANDILPTGGIIGQIRLSIRCFGSFLNYVPWVHCSFARQFAHAPCSVKACAFKTPATLNRPCS